MKRIVDEIGEEFDEYIKSFYVCDLWKIKEGELLVNKTFRRVIDIIADFNLTTTDNILINAYKLIESNEAMMKIMEYLCEEFIHNGNESLLNRAMIFCYSVFMISHSKKITATQVLIEAINSEVVFKKETIFQKFLYWIKINIRPYYIQGDTDALLLISVLNGNPAKEVIENLAELKEYI
jgi:hypothetical protein